MPKIVKIAPRSMKNLNQFLDELLKEGRAPFTTRVGPIQLYKLNLPTQPNILSVEACHFNDSKLNGKEKLDFSDESFNSGIKKEDDSSYGSSYEKDLITPENFLRFPPGKNFPCPFKNCKKIYTSSYGLKYHMDHGHTAEKNNERRPYACEIDNCGKTYKNNNSLKYHIMHAHKDYISNKPEFFNNSL